MLELAALGVRSFVVTSGTLAPLGSFARSVCRRVVGVADGNVCGDVSELATPFDVRLENPHVVGRSAARRGGVVASNRRRSDQVFVGVITHGPGARRCARPSAVSLSVRAVSSPRR